MLNIYFGEMPEAIYDTAIYFRHAYKDQWITDTMTVEMIRDVDRSEVVGSGLIQSPVLDPISPLQLSGGVKTIILINKDSEKYLMPPNAGITAPNGCSKWMRTRKKSLICGTL